MGDFCGKGHDIEVVNVAGSDYKIVVVDSPELQPKLRSAGWTTVEANAEGILELLKSKRA